MKVLKHRVSLMIVPEDESDEAFLEDTMGFSHINPTGVVKVVCAPDPGSPIGARTGEVWNLTIESINVKPKVDIQKE